MSFLPAWGGTEEPDWVPGAADKGNEEKETSKATSTPEGDVTPLGISVEDVVVEHEDGRRTVAEGSETAPSRAGAGTGVEKGSESDSVEAKMPSEERKGDEDRGSSEEPRDASLPKKPTVHSFFLPKRTLTLEGAGPLIRFLPPLEEPLPSTWEVRSMNYHLPLYGHFTLLLRP